MSHFKYSRVTKVAKKDENGSAIPILDEKGLPTNQVETEEKVFQDTMNLDMVIRSYRASEEKLIVLLKDGHETTEKTPVLINPKKPPVESNIREEKVRMWVQSEILLYGEDINRFFEALGV